MFGDRTLIVLHNLQLKLHNALRRVCVCAEIKSESKYKALCPAYGFIIHAILIIWTSVDQMELDRLGQEKRAMHGKYCNSCVSQMNDFG